MERLTKKLSNGVADWNYSNICYGEDTVKNKVFRSIHRQNGCNRLAAYEDTGLAPEDCAEYKKFEDNLCASGVPFSRIIELVNAEKEGRITIRPLVRTCPQCHRNHLVARTDGKFYYCFGCKTQFTESEIREARP